MADVLLDIDMLFTIPEVVSFEFSEIQRTISDESVGDYVY